MSSPTSYVDLATQVINFIIVILLAIGYVLSKTKKFRQLFRYRQEKEVRTQIIFQDLRSLSTSMDLVKAQVGELSEQWSNRSSDLQQITRDGSSSTPVARYTPPPPLTGRRQRSESPPARPRIEIDF